MKPRILILFAHPAFEKSRVNRVLIQNLASMEGITFRDLYQEYPDFDIHVPNEKALLEAHELLVFHYPMYWYSTPSLIKEYLDLVLEHGWAYGMKGNALQGKYMMHVITTGAQEKTYGKAGSNHFTIRQLLAPMEQTASLCKMHFLPPFVVYGSLLKTEQEIDAFRHDLELLYHAFLDKVIDFEKAAKVSCLNSLIPELKK
ncbi:MAG: NAD(P)H-dependent oxidoreductase [Bacteroidales bacterium]|nr:NAD(P)H-dependent oxidoreductase [Bacteroidales bacterium]MDD2322698.1 NAD(P)H-dependent oxidoreductase [Bacteroidales bacterium]MDD3011333.1 NAD(P)H-dependent oxidoreductase [Bacteroidales bacterium]MDD3961713.1 NAD(P)H-dependent oxidoreductase [Bacteroidales bacterium]MDY0285300.1 NAD(P)H-dependent oxidoreductase [Bacteroidales bacterium]